MRVKMLVLDGAKAVSLSRLLNTAFMSTLHSSSCAQTVSAEMIISNIAKNLLYMLFSVGDGVNVVNSTLDASYNLVFAH